MSGYNLEDLIGNPRCIAVISRYGTFPFPLVTEVVHNRREAPEDSFKDKHAFLSNLLRNSPSPPPPPPVSGLTFSQCLKFVPYHLNYQLSAQLILAVSCSFCTAEYEFDLIPEFLSLAQLGHWTGTLTCHPLKYQFTAVESSRSKCLTPMFSLCITEYLGAPEMGKAAG